MTIKNPEAQVLRKMVRDEMTSTFYVAGGPASVRVKALRAAIAALEAPPLPPPVVKEIVVRMGGHATSTKYRYTLHENGTATRITDSDKEFRTEAPLSWKMRDDGVTLEIAFT